MNIKNTIRGCIEKYLDGYGFDYYFELNGFKIPTNLISNNKKKLNLKNNRNKLLKDQSPYSINMKNYLDNLRISYIQEFIIVIQNTSLWQDILESFNLEKEEYERYKFVNYFSLDYFIGESLVCIEVDSDYHNSRKVLDKARDIYLRYEFKIETFRFYHFDSFYSNTSDLLKRLKLSFPVNLYNLFNYRDIIFNNFIYENEYLLIILERFIKRIKNPFITKTYIITEKDYNDLAKGIDFGPGIKPIIFSEDFINLSKNVFSLDITICKNITNYGIDEIIKVLNNINISYIDVFRLFNCIPNWTVVLKNEEVPQIYKNNIRINKLEDNLILDLIKNGRLKNP